MTARDLKPVGFLCFRLTGPLAFGEWLLTVSGWKNASQRVTYALFVLSGASPTALTPARVLGFTLARACDPSDWAGFGAPFGTGLGWGLSVAVADERSVLGVGASDTSVGAVFRAWGGILRQWDEHCATSTLLQGKNATLRPAFFKTPMLRPGVSLCDNASSTSRGGCG